MTTFSSGGPTPYDHILKPDISAPGQSILSSVPAARRTSPARSRCSTGRRWPRPRSRARRRCSCRRTRAGRRTTSSRPSWARPQPAFSDAAGPSRPRVLREGAGFLNVGAADHAGVAAEPSSLSYGFVDGGRGATKTLGATLVDHRRLGPVHGQREPQPGPPAGRVRHRSAGRSSSPPAAVAPWRSSCTCPRARLPATPPASSSSSRAPCSGASRTGHTSSARPFRAVQLAPVRCPGSSSDHPGPPRPRRLATATRPNRPAAPCRRASRAASSSAASTSAARFNAGVTTSGEPAARSCRCSCAARREQPSPARPACRSTSGRSPSPRAGPSRPPALWWAPSRRLHGRRRLRARPAAPALPAALWVNDLKPPRCSLSRRRCASAGPRPPSLSITDAASGVDPRTVVASRDAASRAAALRPATRSATLVLPPLGRDLPGGRSPPTTRRRRTCWASRPDRPQHLSSGSSRSRHCLQSRRQ